MTSTPSPPSKTAERSDFDQESSTRIAIISVALAVVAVAVLSLIRVPWVWPVAAVLIGMAWIVPGRSTRARLIITGVVATAVAIYVGYLFWSGAIGGYSVGGTELE